MTDDLKAVEGLVSSCRAMALQCKPFGVAKVLNDAADMIDALSSQSPPQDGRADWICSGLPDEAIEAGIAAWDAAKHDMANYVASETTDWDEGMIVAAIYKAVRDALPAKVGCVQQSELIPVLTEAVHDRLFGISSLADPALALQEISDGGGIHEAVHSLLRALPAKSAATPPQKGGEVERARELLAQYYERVDSPSMAAEVRSENWLAAQGNGEREFLATIISALRSGACVAEINRG